jgi:ribonuclease HII
LFVSLVYIRKPAFIFDILLILMKLPDFYYEKRLWKSGLKFVAGADEVGRGSFAGPVVASSVVLAPNPDFNIPIFNKKGEKVVVNDSKKLTMLQREKADVWIKKHSLAFGIGIGSVALINRRGLAYATNFAFRSAINNARNYLNNRINYLLVDAFYIPYTRGFRIPHKSKRKNNSLNTKGVNQLALIKGDSVSYSIAAASIIAKVYRDNYMQKLAKQKRYAVYGWDKNKGYGTKEHRETIKLYGTNKHHRIRFVRTFLDKNKLLNDTDECSSLHHFQ